MFHNCKMKKGKSIPVMLSQRVRGWCEPNLDIRRENHPGVQIGTCHAAVQFAGSFR